jgi:hypothetical protein
MSSQNRQSVTSSFFLFAAVLLFATSAAATDVPFEKLPYGVPLHSEQPGSGAGIYGGSSNGPGAGDLTVRRPGAPAGAAVVLAAYRTPAARDPQPRYGVPTSTGSFGSLPFLATGSSSGLPFGRTGSTGVGFAGSIAALAPSHDTGGTRHWGDFDEAPDGGDTDIIDSGSSSSAPVPEPSAVLVFGLGALLVKTATGRRQR